MKKAFFIAFILLGVIVAMPALAAHDSNTTDASCPSTWVPQYGVSCSDPARPAACGGSGGTPRCIATGSVPGGECVGGTLRVNCDTCSASCTCAANELACSGGSPALFGTCTTRNECDLAGRESTNLCTGACGDCQDGFIDTTPATRGDPCVPERPAVTLAPFASDTDNTGSPSIWVNKVPRPGETVVAQPLAQLQENGSDRFNVDPNGNLRIIGRSTTEGGNVYLNSGKSIQVDGRGETVLNIGNWGTGATGIQLNIFGALTLGAVDFRRNLTVFGDIMLSGEEVLLGVNNPTGDANLLIANDAQDRTLHALQMTVSGALRVNEDIQADGSIRGNFVASDGSSCTADQVLQRSTDGASWVCARAGGTYEAGRNIDAAELEANRLAVVGAPNFDRLTVGSASTELSRGENLIYGAVSTTTTTGNVLLLEKAAPRGAGGGGGGAIATPELLQVTVDGDLFLHRDFEGRNITARGNLTVGGSLVNLGADAGGQNLIGGSAPYANMHSGDALLQLSSLAADGSATGQFVVDRNGTVSTNGNLAVFGTTLTTGFVVLNSGKAISANKPDDISTLAFRNAASGSRGMELGIEGNLSLKEAPAAMGHITLGTDKEIRVINGSGTSHLKITNPSTRDTRELPGTAVHIAGDLQLSRSGAFGGYDPDVTWKVTTPSLYVGDGTPSGSTFIGAGAGQGAGDIFTGRRLTVGGSYRGPTVDTADPGTAPDACSATEVHLNFDGDSPVVVDDGECYLPPSATTGSAVIGGELAVFRGARVRGDLVTEGRNRLAGGNATEYILGIGPSDSNRNTPAARLSEYLRIQNMDNDEGSDNPEEQFAIQVEDEDGNEWFSVRRTGYIGGFPAPVKVSTSGEMNARTLRGESVLATGVLSGPRLDISDAGDISVLRVGSRATVGTATTNLGLEAGGDSLITGVANYDTMNSTDYLLRLRTVGPIPGGRGPTDRLTLNREGGLSVVAINTVGGIAVGSSLFVGSTATVGSSLDVASSITSGSLNRPVTNATGELWLGDIAGNNFDDHPTSGTAATIATNEGYLIIGLKSSQGTCDNACSKHGLLCDSAYQVGSTSLAGGGTNGCGNTTSNKYCWCKG